ncbi:LOW QUALITY PROTEIN: hypothetical protein HID58_061711 [Brassica napus]|uniref:Uncharacterized protein n=1 Tax=Brassica napus TaxID=3708 RepID=A0ABQ7ZZD6_BRANA|nr:LOW QUALITY PROTEIN: hypothetical protein HID58_061711 [Brassica napus]
MTKRTQQQRRYAERARESKSKTEPSKRCASQSSLVLRMRSITTDVVVILATTSVKQIFANVLNSDATRPVFVPRFGSDFRSCPLWRKWRAALQRFDEGLNDQTLDVHPLPAYNIGDRMVSIEAIQSYILRIMMPRPGQIRVYTPTGIYQELETAKEESVHSTFGVKKDHKLVLPKIIESFSTYSGLSQATLMEMIQKCLPETMKKRIKKLNSGRSRKSIVELMPHSCVYMNLFLCNVIGEVYRRMYVKV